MATQDLDGNRLTLSAPRQFSAKKKKKKNSLGSFIATLGFMLERKILRRFSAGEKKKKKLFLGNFIATLGFMLERKILSFFFFLFVFLPTD